MSRTAWYALIALVAVAALAATVLVLLPERPVAQRRLERPADAPESPAVSARYAAWTDREGGGATGVWVFDSAGGSVKRVTPEDAECSQPAIAGDSVVYVDQRADEGDLYRYDAVSGETEPFVVAPGRQSAPAADGEWVAWEDDRTGFGPKVRARRLDSGTVRTVPAASRAAVQRRPQVGDGLVVFEEYGEPSGGNAAIRGFDLDEERPETFADADGVRLLPSTDGTSVAWCEQKGSSLDVVVLDRRSGARSSPPTQAMERTTPAVWDGTLYWVERRGEGRFGLDSWRPGDATPTPLPASGSENRVAPRVAHGSRIWLELRQGRWFVRADLAGPAGGGRRPRGGAAAGGGTDVPPPFGSAPPARLLPVQASAALAAPGSPLAAVAGTSAVRVTWRAASGGTGRRAYEVYRDDAPVRVDALGGASLVATTASLSATVPLAADEATAAYTLYYAVLARDEAGDTALSVNTVPDPHGTASGDAVTCRRCHLNPGTAPDPASRRNCYRCHGDTASTREYGAGSPADAQASFRDDTSSPLPDGGSRHRNSFMTANTRECDACHTPHRKPYDADPAASHTMLLRTQLATAPSGQTGYRYDTSAAPVGDRFCFDCHGSNVTPMTLAGGATAYLNAGGDHETGWERNPHSSKVPAPAPDPGIRCGACHDPHGSQAEDLLGRFDPASGSNLILGSPIGEGADVCLACHRAPANAWPSFTRDASGYPVAGTWPGAEVYGRAYDPAARTGSMHTTANAVWPGSAYRGGDCRNCHRMHGPGGPFDILRVTQAPGTTETAAFGPGDFSLCFGCHDGTPASDISRLYPASSGGTGDAPRAGHVTRSPGSLPSGSALPCYDCHDPHGTASAFGLTVVTQVGPETTVVVGDVEGELAMGQGRTDADVRRFCLSCHTTADGASGWSGTTTVTVTPGARFEGIDRVSPDSRLRLPDAGGHRDSDLASCYACHGDDYSGTPGNVHSPLVPSIDDTGGASTAALRPRVAGGMLGCADDLLPHILRDLP